MVDQFKEHLQWLSNRADAVIRRLEALEIEQKNLRAELEHIEPLVKVWLSLPYDPITEEVTVTTKLTHKPARAKTQPISRKESVPKGILLDKCKEIFLHSEEGLTRTNLQKEISARMGYTVATSAVHYNLDKLLNSTDMYKVVKKDNRYILAGFA